MLSMYAMLQVATVAGISSFLVSALHNFRAKGVWVRIYAQPKIIVLVTL